MYYRDCGHFFLSTIPSGFLSMFSATYCVFVLLFSDKNAQSSQLLYRPKASYFLRLFHLWEPKGPSSAAIFLLCFPILLTKKVYTHTHTHTPKISNQKNMVAFSIFGHFHSHSYPLGSFCLLPILVMVFIFIFCSSISLLLTGFTSLFILLWLFSWSI